jgi:osmotically inducible protein OsmC
MSTLYSTKVSATGGRHGSIRSDDGLLEASLAIPSVMGGKGGATNPEQLFAGGYAACFENAIFHVAKAKGVKFREDDVEVAATVGLSPNTSGGFALSAALDVVIAGVEQAKAEEVVAAAHQVCPYSNAIRGNVDVKISVATR